MVNKNTNILISNIFKSRQVVLELMEYQGYNVEEYANFSVNEVNAMKMNDQLDMLLDSTPESAAGGRKIYIRYYLEKVIRPANLHEMIDDLFITTETLKKQDTLYIITKDKPNDTLVEELKYIWERDGIFIVIESIRHLQFNILKHSLVPEHTVITEDDVNAIMIRYNITDKAQFPDISRFDPVARAIGIRPGQVCHIVRPSKTAITTDYYRICV